MARARDRNALPSSVAEGPEEAQHRGADKFAELGMFLRNRCASNRKDLSHIGIKQTLAKNALTDHSRCAERNNFHSINPEISPKTWAAGNLMQRRFVSKQENRVRLMRLYSWE